MTLVRFTFKDENTFEQRKEEAQKVLSKYPDRVPVIVERMPRTGAPPLDKRKFLIPLDISVAQFSWIIRKRIQLDSDKALFLYVDRIIPSSGVTMGQLYKEHKEEDNFLYISYGSENVFGGRKP